jgi:hypothetical protein
MRSRLAKNETGESFKGEFALRRADKLADAIFTIGHARQLLEGLRNTYQALSLEERKQVTTFICELKVSFS